MVAEMVKEHKDNVIRGMFVVTSIASRCYNNLITSKQFDAAQDGIKDDDQMLEKPRHILDVIMYMLVREL